VNWNFLETVDLSYNRLRRLAAGWLGGGSGRGGDVQLLNLSHNQLESIERDAISHMSAIATLDLSHNRLAGFPQSVFSASCCNKRPKNFDERPRRGRHSRIAFPLVLFGPTGWIPYSEDQERRSYVFFWVRTHPLF